MEFYPALVAQPDEEIALIRMYGATTVALTVNTANMTEEAARAYAQEQHARLGIPVVLPLFDGIDSLVPIFETMIKKAAVAV